MGPARVEQLLDLVSGSPEPPKPIVVDTPAGCMVDVGENSARYMGRFTAGCDRLREATGAPVLVIYHTGKSGGYRGSSASFAAIDAFLSVSRGDNGRLMSICYKQRDHEEAGDMEFV